MCRSLQGVALFALFYAVLVALMVLSAREVFVTNFLPVCRLSIEHVLRTLDARVMGKVAFLPFGSELRVPRTFSFSIVFAFSYFVYICINQLVYILIDAKIWQMIIYHK